MRLALLISASFIPVFLSGHNLTREENQEVTQRLHRLVGAAHHPAAMNAAPPKLDVELRKFVHPHAFLKTPAASPLPRAAGLKSTKAYQEYRCRGIISHHFPSLDCARPESKAWATIEADDKVEALVKTWMKNDELVRSLDDLPIQGETSLKLWSGSYWPVSMGGLSYRYASGKSYSKYADAIGAYEQPKEWDAIAASLSPEALATKVAEWSPSEKYDLSVGDSTFAMTAEQKKLGAHSVKPDGTVPEWFGICDGWAAASIMVPRPIQEAVTVGAKGEKISWYPTDVRALTSLQWSTGQSPFNSIGGRCDSTKLEIYPNGRMVQQECFDTNPATFHLALGNLIGKKQLSLVMDASFDAEVWNQPIASYHFTYFNPNNPDKRSEDWKDVAVKYDSTFKATDPFQKPLTRGKRVAEEKWDDSGIKSVVGVIASIVYVDDRFTPRSSTEAPRENRLRVNYTYDLELQEKDGKLIPTGGEWFQNTHPDFLWIPQKGTMPYADEVDDSVAYDRHTAPDKTISRYARAASQEGYPLCKVVSAVVEASSGHSYVCPTSGDGE